MVDGSSKARGAQGIIEAQRLPYINPLQNSCLRAVI